MCQNCEALGKRVEELTLWQKIHREELKEM